MHLGILNIHLYLCSVSLPIATMDVSIFDGHLDYSGSVRDHKAFLNWLHSMNVYFCRYPFSEAEKVRFATMKQTGQANQY